MKKLFGTLILSASVMGLSACGRDKANATRDYSNLQLQEAHGKEMPAQKLGDLSFQIDGLSGDLPVFNQGVQGNIKFQLKVLDPAIRSAELILSPETKIENSVLEPSPNEPGVWIFKWTPNSVLANGEAEKTYSFQVEAHTPDPVLNAVKFKSQSFVVRRPTGNPRIARDTVPHSIEEGKNVSFTITVQDPVGQGTVPKLYVGAAAVPNIENPTVGITPNCVPGKKESDGTFTYNCSVDASSIPSSPDKNADGILLCFGAIAVSQLTNSSSQESPYCMKAMYAAQPPVPTWDSDPQNIKDSENLTAGTVQTIKFSARTFSGRGNVQVDTSSDRMKKLLASLPADKGSPATLDCGDQKQESASRSCTLTWTPTCKAAGKTYDFSVDMKTIYGKTTKSRPRSDTTRKLVVSKEACS